MGFEWTVVEGGVEVIGVWLVVLGKDSAVVRKLGLCAVFCFALRLACQAPLEVWWYALSDQNVLQEKCDLRSLIINGILEI